MMVGDIPIGDTGRPLHLAAHDSAPPDMIDPAGIRNWITRDEYFVVVISEVPLAGTITRHDDDEHIVILPPDFSLSLAWKDQSVPLGGDSIAIMPPGTTTITAPTGGVIMRVCSTRSTDLAGQAGNAAAYHDARQLVDSFMRKSPSAIRTFDLARLTDPTGPLIQPRIVMTQSLMVNVFAAFPAPRPLNQLRPHHHDDFDQASVVLAGNWVHHIRAPWGDDFLQWANDRHLDAGCPSTVIIPPPLIHTSRNLDAGARLVDVFSPPRRDFLDAGLVLNADDYVLAHHEVVHAEL